MAREKMIVLDRDFMETLSVCYKPKAKAIRGVALHQGTNVLVPAFTRQDEQFYRAFFLLGCAIDRQMAPGAVLAITHSGKLIALKAMGRFTYDLDSPRVQADTVFDLASVTKVAATTAACMVLYERGQLNLDQPLVEVLPEFSGAGSEKNDPRRDQVTFRMLLAHSSGLPAYVKLFETAQNKEELLRQALEVPLAADPGSQAAYSDIGFILLGEALERITGETLDGFCRREIFSPLGLSRMRYLPPEDWRPLIPPTQQSQPQRPYIIQGEVNDENAFIMGGVAGHAGCFGTADDVSIYAHCLLQATKVGGRQLVGAKTVEIFTRREDSPAGSSRALGWDTPSQPSQSGKYFSMRAYGHLGYTGTSLWIDPERQLSVTLLTNRTWPDRSSQVIKQMRPLIHDAIIEAL
jgi:CubicO group peptidase (beta-lactamase class C family)